MKKLTLIVILMMAIGIIPAQVNASSRVLSEESRTCMADAFLAKEDVFIEAALAFQEVVTANREQFKEDVVNAWVSNETLDEINKDIKTANKDRKERRKNAQKEYKNTIKDVLKSMNGEKRNCRKIEKENAAAIDALNSDDGSDDSLDDGSDDDGSDDSMDDGSDDDGSDDSMDDGSDDDGSDDSMDDGSDDDGSDDSMDDGSDDDGSDDSMDDGSDDDGSDDDVDDDTSI